MRYLLPEQINEEKSCNSDHFTTTLCFTLANIVLAPNASADDYQVYLDTAKYADAQDAKQPALTDINAEAGTPSTPGLVPFDLNANVNYQAPTPNPEVLPSQNYDSASTPNVSEQIPLVQQAPQASINIPAQAFTQLNQTEMQTPQEWRKSAFESLTNNPNVQPTFGRTQNQNAAANANSSNAGTNDSNSNCAPNANPNNNAVGMTAMNSPNNMPVNNQPVQSQTLTGPSSNQQQGQATKRGNGSNGYNSGLMGVTRYASMFTMMGAGLMMGTMMRR